MATAMQPNPPPSPRPSDPRLAFRMAMGRYKASRLAAIRLAQGLSPSADRIRPAGTAEELTEHLDQPAAVAALAARLPAGSRLALSLLAVTEATVMPAAGLSHALEVLGADPATSLVHLLDLGLLAIEPCTELGPVDDFAMALERAVPARIQVLAHPSVLRAVRAVRPEGKAPTADGPIGQVRESDGLEPILRLGALWQRAGAEPIRQTQQGPLYKRDQERILEDPVLAGPIADAIAPLPDLAALWLALGQRVGLIEPDASGQRLMAASPDFWSDNAVHLSQMIAVAWLTLRAWQEPAGALPPLDPDAAASEPALPFLRPAVLFWLATLDEREWVPLDDLAGHLAARSPAWDRSTITDAPDGGVVVSEGTGSTALQPTRRGGPTRGRARPAPEPPRGVSLLEAILLGAAYPLGLVRAGEERETGRRVVQLTPLGRYVLAAGPTPPPRPAFEQFLFVQPNFEVIAYRQGLTPQIVGRLSRFAWWTQVGAALELRLTRESILFGLEGGVKPDAMLDVLKRHSQRALPSGVVDALRTWATHRERVTYYAGATLIEFSSRAERDQALESWPRDDGGPQREPPVAVADRFLLIEDERAIPFGQFRMTGSRDYRRPPEVCVGVEPDGISMTLDPSRSDLLVDAELSRFADEVPSARPAHGHGRGSEPAGRRFVVTAASLRRSLERGLTIHDLSDWYARRTGADIPPAVGLLLTPTGPAGPALEAVRMLVLTVPDARMLDGLLQHPVTRRWLGDRLGPTAVAISDDHLEPLRKALQELGIALNGE
jgi:hypothetical protein